MTFLGTIESIFSNLGMSLEVGLSSTLLLGTLIFYAKDFKLGLVITFFVSGLLTMMWYAFDLNYVPTLSVMIICLILMSLTFYAVSKVSAKTGGII